MRQQEPTVAVPLIKNFENTGKRGVCKSLWSYILWEIFTLTCCIALLYCMPGIIIFINLPGLNC